MVEDNEIDTERINRYIVSRALCCPFNPDELVNGSLSSHIINNSTIQELAKNIIFWSTPAFEGPEIDMLYNNTLEIIFK